MYPIWLADIWTMGMLPIFFHSVSVKEASYLSNILIVSNDIWSTWPFLNRRFNKNVNKLSRLIILGNLYWVGAVHVFWIIISFDKSSKVLLATWMILTGRILFVALNVEYISWSFLSSKSTWNETRNLVHTSECSWSLDMKSTVYMSKLGIFRGETIQTYTNVYYLWSDFLKFWHRSF